MDSGASNHMASCRMTFYTYKVIVAYNVYLDDDSIMETIGMGSIVVEVMVKGKIQRICIKDASMW